MSDRNDSTSKTTETPSRRAFLKWIGVAPAVGWLASACDTAATTGGAGADAALQPDGLGGADGGAAGQDVALAGDVAAPDATKDALALPDIAADAGADAGPRGGKDAGPGLDGGKDAGPGLDAVLDAGPGTDTGLDAGGDVAVDAGGDVAMDAGPSADTAPDTTEPEVCIQTGDDAKGPYYLEDPPFTTVIAEPGEPGDRLFVSGQVLDEACAPLDGALVDVWQADATGTYDLNTVKYRLRGQMLANGSGAYAFDTIVPGGYPQNGSFRPKHVHFTVSAPGYWPVTTQLYFEGDPYLQPNDPCSTCSSDDETHIRPLLPAPAGKQGYQCAFDVVLKKKTR